MTWRDKQKREVDFIWPRRGKSPVAIEVKWKADSFDPKGILAFRELHPGETNFVVASDIITPYTCSAAGIDVTFIPIHSLADEINKISSRRDVN